MQNLYQFVKYSLINSRNWIHDDVINDVTLHINVRGEESLHALTHHNTDPDSMCDEAEKTVHAYADASDDNAENSSNNEDDTDDQRVLIFVMRVD